MARRGSFRTRPLAFLAAGALGCAHAPGPDPHTSGAGSATPAADPPASQVPTGSRIARPVDPATGKPTTPGPMRSYSQDELLKTGRIQPSESLKQLDPAIGR